MKIAVFHNLPPGGAKRVLSEQVKFLANNHDVDLYVYSSMVDKLFDVIKHCKKVFKYDFELDSKRGLYSRLHLDYKNFITLRRVNDKIAVDIDKNNYDVVLVRPDKYTQAPFVLRNLITRSLYYCDEYLRIVYEKQFEFDDEAIYINKIYEKLTRTIMKNIDKKNAKSASLIVANSKFTKRNIENAYRIESEYVNPGVDVNVFKPIDRRHTKKILYLGDENDRVGYRLMKEITREASEHMRVEVDVLSMGKFQNLTTDEELAKKYSQSLALLCTQHNEPFGLAPIESMACETPVLAVNEGGYKETVVDEKTGFLLPRDPEIFAQKIKLLIKNPEKVREMGKAGREHVKKNFTWAKHNKQIEKHLQYLASL